MGLDNGICIRRNEKAMRIYDKIKRFDLDYLREGGYDMDVCYYRKCWNVRNLISQAIGGIEDNGETVLYRGDVHQVIVALKSLNAKNWNDCGGSIWEWSEQKPNIKQHIKNLKYLYKLMEKYDIDVYFYDSY